MAGFAQLLTVVDPRDRLEKARLDVLIKFARANGIDSLHGKPIDQNPAILIRKELRQRRLTNIPIQDRPLGSMAVPATMADNGPGVDASDDLARQFKTQAPPPPPPATAPKPPKQTRLMERPKQEINVLRDECKRLGIPMGRRDSKADLKAKIAEHNAKNAAPINQ